MKPVEETIERDKLDQTDRDQYISLLVGMRKKAFSEGLWLPHMPKDWGGMGLGHVELAMVQAEAAKSYYGPWVLNCQAPDEGNMHTLLHWGTDEQLDRYLKPLCEGRATPRFAMTKQVAGSTRLIQTSGYEDGDEWVITGHKWFISNAHRAIFDSIVRTEENLIFHRQAIPPSLSTCHMKDGPKCARLKLCTEAQVCEILIEEMRVNK